MTRVSLIWAQDEQGVIGRGNALPWHLPADMQWFRRQTLGKPLLMGRRTFESIGRPLPGRLNIVLSRTSAGLEGCQLARSLAEALEIAGAARELMVMGGAQVYAQALPHATRLYMTLVHGRFQGDVYFPPFDRRAWRVVAREEHNADQCNAWPCSFMILERGRAPQSGL
ncbi:MAG: type 3 dihydrofolate reductase [Zetaproteobacteria bacterium]|nr:MAG: type 3 dihydrofolate reductase [Zetaproteobacteria bacterium]